ncbi:hypothetical protein B0H34DRAFT_795215 [Crassisporium funariophilum]|nr:hypothetical protein B0H34DRAFT_795215 [Crassisporium funariophilum]
MVKVNTKAPQRKRRSEEENDDNLIDMLESGDEDDDQPQESKLAFPSHLWKLLNSAELSMIGFSVNDLFKQFTESIVQKSKKSMVRSRASQSRKEALYQESRKTAQEIVRDGVAYLESVQAQVSELHAQEIGFQKYFEDCHLPFVAQQDSFNRVMELYPQHLQELGRRRATEMDAASAMLANNGPERRDAVRKFSQKARAQLEQAKRNEKDASDATALIKHYKSLLRS